MKRAARQRVAAARPRETDNAADYSWLCRDEAARTRLLDMDARLHRARLVAYAAVAIATAALAPLYAPWRTVSVVLLGATFTAVSRFGAARSPKPELWNFWGLVLGPMLGCALAAALTGGPRSPFLLWIGLFILFMSARFDWRGTSAGIAISVLLVLAVALSHGTSALAEAPALTVVTLASLVIIPVYVEAIARSDQDHRADSILDPLTGLLNRRSLQTRLEELNAQAQRAKLPVTAVAMDIDHFKHVNDRFGHEVGDVVLRDVAYALRKQLRHFDLLYRVGGEEFLLLLPGAESGTARLLAEQLRLAVCDSRPGGHDVTISLGVATFAPDEEREIETVLQRADIALYEAKRGGRDRVCVADGQRSPQVGPSLAPVAPSAPAVR